MGLSPNWAWGFKGYVPFWVAQTSSFWPIPIEIRFRVLRKGNILGTLSFLLLVRSRTVFSGGMPRTRQAFPGVKLSTDFVVRPHP